jgi:hypothetical protein
MLPQRLTAWSLREGKCAVVRVQTPSGLRIGSIERVQDSGVCGSEEAHAVREHEQIGFGNELRLEQSCSEAVEDVPSHV